MGWAYQLAHGVAFVVGLPYYALTRGGAHKYLGVLGPRFGHPPLAGARDGIWIQAVSVGEVGVAEILARPLRAALPDLPLFVTTTTATGQARARSAFGDGNVGYLPFDFAPVVRRAVACARPRLFASIETEIWPGLFEALADAHVPIALVNARLSDRSFPRYRSFRRLLAPTLARVDLALASSALDAERLAAIGLAPERIRVTGNVKFDREPPSTRLPWEDDRQRLFGSRPVFVAGSTTSTDEEQAVLAAFRQSSAGGRDAALVLAPRHPPRFDEAAKALDASGLRWTRRSELAATSDAVDVLLLDTLGELGRAYAFARGAFVGGSLDAKGGHNPIEASLFGVPVAVGPHTANFRDVVETLARAGGLAIASDGEALGRLWRRWLAEPEEARLVGEAGRAIVAASRGAAERSARELARLTGR